MSGDLINIDWRAIADKLADAQAARKGLATTEECLAAASYLGPAGAILSGSKRTPRGREDHTIYWNACVFNKRGGPIWYGDLDVTARHDELQELAEQIGTIYVTPEQPWRFDGFHETKKIPRYRERMIKFKG